MTERKSFKKRVRARAAKSGESYTAARHQVIQQAAPADDLDPAYLAEVTGMSNEAVAKRTGKDWNKWVAVLDTAQADRWKHPEIAKYLHERHKLSGWWSQMVTVGYERIRGIRAKHEVSGGFAVSKSKTVGVPVSVLFEAWYEESSRRAWLDAELTLSTSTFCKTIRFVWDEGPTRVDVYFLAKGEEKSQVTVQHRKLADGKEAESRKAYWGERLEELKRVLED